MQANAAGTVDKIKLLQAAIPEDRAILASTFRASNQFTIDAISALVDVDVPPYNGKHLHTAGQQADPPALQLRDGSGGTNAEDAEAPGWLPPRPAESTAQTQKLQSEQVGTEKFVAEVRKSIKASNGISLPDPDNIPANAIFRMIEFGPVVSDGPGRGLHSAPNPDLLRLRNLDAQCNRAYRNGELEGLPPIEKVSAAFSVACLDMDPLGGSCMLCRHHMSRMDPELVQPFAEDDFEALQMSEAQAECGGGVWGEARESESAPGEASPTASEVPDGLADSIPWAVQLGVEAMSISDVLPAATVSLRQNCTASV